MNVLAATVLVLAALVCGVLVGLVLANEAQLRRRAREASARAPMLDLSAAAARGELSLDVDWAFPRACVSRELGSPGSVRA